MWQTQLLESVITNDNYSYSIYKGYFRNIANGSGSVSAIVICEDF